MRLSDLSPAWLQWSATTWPDAEGQFTYRHGVTRAEANGLIFLCPKCYLSTNRQTVGVHSVICWDPTVPQHEYLVGPGRWRLDGDSFDTLSLVASSSSVALKAGCMAHFFIDRGAIRMT